MTHIDLLPTALDLDAAGLCVVPASTDGTKAPLGAWKRYQTERPDHHTIHVWFTGGHPGIGVVTGAVSGNLELLELEGRAVEAGLLGEARDLAAAAGLADLWARLTAGYVERTPSGGVHLLYRLDGEVPGNTKLARDEHRESLIETRGEGGYVVVAPSHGPVHPTGQPWQLAAGGPHAIPTITAGERQALHAVLRALDRTPQPDPAPPFTQPGSGNGDQDDGSTPPGADYNNHTDWADILTPRGWAHVATRGRVRYWRRPGKTIGVSATSGRGDTDNLFVFSTSTDFEPETPYSKFGAYTVFEHGGDYKKAARALAEQGYGAPPPEPPRTVHQPQGDDGDEPAAAVTREPVTYSRTDDGNALRLVDTHRDTIRYCPQRGAWLAWDGHRWSWDEAGHIHEHARAIARDLPRDTKADDKHRERSLGVRSLKAMVDIARTDPRTVTGLADLDSRAYQLNTPDGVVDLTTGALTPSDPDALHTRSTLVGPDFDAEPGRWLAFLADTFAGDPEITDYVQRMLGCSLIGEVREQMLPFAYGEGANGKTTLLDVAQRLLVLGVSGYALTSPAELLLATSSVGHPTEVARLAGARLVVASELDEGQKFAESRVKLLTGKDALTGRFMRQDFFDFRPTHSLWLLGNHQPTVRTGGLAFWRRLRLVPFLHTVPPESRDSTLVEKLIEDEGPAILAWMIRGAVSYLAGGMNEPESVKVATDSYAHDQDTIGRFVEEECETGPAAMPHMRVKVSALRVAYERWCRAEGETPTTPKTFTLTLRSRYGVESHRDRSSRFYTGIRHVDPDAEPSHDWSEPSRERGDAA